MHSSAFRLFAVTMIVMGLSHTIAKEKLFAPVRDACGRCGELVAYLVSCPFCLSYWIAFALVPLTDAYAIHVDWHWPLLSRAGSWFLSSVFVAVAAAFLRVGFYFIDENQGLLRRREKLEDIALQRERERRHDDAPASSAQPRANASGSGSASARRSITRS